MARLGFVASLLALGLACSQVGTEKGGEGCEPAEEEAVPLDVSDPVLGFAPIDFAGLGDWSGTLGEAEEELQLQIVPGQRASRLLYDAALQASCPDALAVQVTITLETTSVWGTVEGTLWMTSGGQGELEAVLRQQPLEGRFEGGGWSGAWGAEGFSAW